MYVKQNAVYDLTSLIERLYFSICKKLFCNNRLFKTM